ncbi:hypothetical protein N7455_004908 [Penicillium solitum]|uniref:uncharacterized protein n=1 Tax=Penicillium solitum TaxID=60172 RepID=UPI0017AB1A5D|nr:hypothetical protein HAV15_004091 [Penicillium sp. str. \
MTRYHGRRALDVVSKSRKIGGSIGGYIGEETFYVMQGRPKPKVDSTRLYSVQSACGPAYWTSSELYQLPPGSGPTVWTTGVGSTADTRDIYMADRLLGVYGILFGDTRSIIGKVLHVMGT